MPRRHPQSLDASTADERRATADDGGQITGLSGRDLAVAQFVRDTRDEIHNILAAPRVDADIVGRGGEGDERVAFAAGI
jgi:hypothetical protein